MNYKDLENIEKTYIRNLVKPISYRIDIAALMGEKVKCNLSCPYCHKDYFPVSQPYNSESKMSFVNIIKMLDKTISNKNRPRKIHLSGRAEPLIVTEKLLIDEIASLSENFPDYDMAMTTNGILLEDLCEELTAAGLKRFNVSMHNKINPKSKIVRGMKKAVTCGAKVSMNVMISEATIDNLEELIDFAKKNTFKLKLFYELGIPEKSMKEQLLKAIKKVTLLTSAKGQIDPVKNRMIFDYKNTSIEIKLLESLLTRPDNCRTCDYKSICKEGCWESIRITPWYIKPCGVKEDNVYFFDESSYSSLRQKLIAGSKIEKDTKHAKRKRGVA